MKLERTVLALLIALFLTAVSTAFADDRPEDGRYEARIETEEGIYRVPVVVQDGAVTSIRWPNGRMKVNGIDLTEGQTIGRNYNGDRYKISIDNPQADERNKRIKQFDED